MADTGQTNSLRATIQWVGLIGGPVLALVAFILLPQDYVNADGATVPFTTGGRATVAVMVWMATWWLTEAIDISATALLPLALFPLLGVATIKDAAAPFAHELIFLFMGGFMLALSMQRWGLNKRIALITLRIVGTRPVNMVAGFMIATAVLSAFVSNTATAAMMLPIAVSVIDLALGSRPSAVDRTADQSPSADTPADSREPTAEGPGRNFALCLMLGIAYAASIGGIATIIGTPPNAILIAFISDGIDPQFQQSISFAKWMTIGVPLALVFLPVTWLLLTRVIYPIRIREIEGGKALITEQLRELGPAKPGEWITFIVFCYTAILWITRPIIANGWPKEIDKLTGEVLTWYLKPIAPGLTDAGIAMIGGLILFIIPVSFRTHTFTMNWDTARRLPWGILILFGGGLSLAAAVGANGVAEFLGSLASNFAGMPDVIIVLIICAAVIFLTELTSNTATTATLVPILAALAPGLDIHPYLLIVPAALAASCAFMMPVATPPNAIVFGSGHVTIPQMCKAGLWLNVIGIALITLLTMALVGPVLGV